MTAPGATPRAQARSQMQMPRGFHGASLQQPLPYGSRPAYQTRQAFSRTIGSPALQLKAFWNSGILEIGPFTR